MCKRVRDMRMICAILPDDYELGGELVSDGHDDRIKSCRALDQERSRTVREIKWWKDSERVHTQRKNTTTLLDSFCYFSAGRPLAMHPPKITTDVSYAGQKHKSSPARYSASPMPPYGHGMLMLKPSPGPTPTSEADPVPG